jgi:2-polyprenyl-3-methyl-5-hydroxy-6-metoxy-1,4-benzoquinol methylase
MSELPTIDQVMERIRAQVRQQPGDVPSARPDAARQRPRQVGAPARASSTVPDDLSRLQSEVNAALDSHLQVGQLNPRPPGLHNRVLQSVKKVMRRSLTWYTRPLQLFQASAIRSLQHVGSILQSQGVALQDHAAAVRQTAEQLESFRTERRELEHTLRAELCEKHAELEQKLQLEIHRSSGNLARQSERIDELQEQVRQAAVITRGRERDVRRLRHALEAGHFPVQPSATTPAMFPSEIRHEAEFDYFLFEDHYRGNETDVRGRQSAYLELFRGCDGVIDIGCGRGEFLELLRDNSIAARGVELGTDQYLLCREKGLDVVQQDLFTFLESQADASLGGLFSAQVIEHMTASDQLRFVSLAYQKCSPDAPVIFETINPECIYALVHNFFLDPTHVRPVHPGTLKFAMESQGFRNVQLRFSSPVNDRSIPRLVLDSESESLQRFNAAMGHVNELLYGYQDYAAIGRK